MKTIIHLLGLFFIISLLSSCSTTDSVVTGRIIQKRKYNKGFYVNRNNNNVVKYKIESLKTGSMDSNYSESFSMLRNKNAKDEPLVKSNLMEHNIINKKVTTYNSSNTYMVDADGGINSGVDDSSAGFRGDSRNGLIQTLSLDAKMEKRAKRIHKKISRKIDNHLKKDEIDESKYGEERSQIVAALLVFFIGFLGVHRMYLGYVGIGIIQLLTLGGCGLWSLIDLVRILIGDLQPKNGKYYDSFSDL